MAERPRSLASATSVLFAGFTGKSGCETWRFTLLMKKASLGFGVRTRGFVFQFFYLLPTFTVEENVGLRAKKQGKRLPRAIGRQPTHRRWQLAPDWTRISGPGLEGLIHLI